MAHRATLIPGDGIGPEITAATLRVLEVAGAEFDWDRQIAGMGAGIVGGIDARLGGRRIEQPFEPQAVGLDHGAHRLPTLRQPT